jgi:flagellar hook-length control protein FliK
MLGNTQALAPQSAPPPVVLSANPTATRADTGPSFAQMLSDHGSPPAVAHPAPADSTPAPASATANAQEAAAAARRAAAAPKPASPGAAPAGTQARPAEASVQNAQDVKDGSDAASTHRAEGKAASADADDARTPDQPDGSLDEFAALIGLAPTPQALPATPQDALVQAASTSGSDTDAAAGSQASRGKGGTGGAGRTGHTNVAATTEAPTDSAEPAGMADAGARDARSSTRRSAEAGRASAAESQRAGAAQVTRTADGAQAGDAQQTRFATLLRDAVDTINPALALAGAAPGANPSPLDAPTSSTRLMAPLHSSDFGPDLAASVSLLAVDGVQSAELQLNPAEMGPVAVQIVLDGNQAQVSFQAAQAETRQALEQSLPDLAAALQGSGLTLSGGGVSQQAPRDQQAGNEPGNTGGARERGGRSGGPVEAARVGSGGGAAAAARRSQGLIDTFA